MGNMLLRDDLITTTSEKDFENMPAHWQTFLRNYDTLGDDVLNRQQEMHRLLKENGVTYNIYDSQNSNGRNWNLDIIPYLISKEEWDFTEKGLIQRAELLNLVLKDIYGDKKLIKNGILPMELVYNHKGFLRQCDGMMNRRKHSLVIYSANMAKGANGKIWVISDRTQAPSGTGYALENRLAFARTVPELFKDLKVRWLAPYFDALTSSLNSISPQRQQNPRVVILTPGPGNETYFEHSYLASYLGFTLVQGNDLMVKDNYVWLKTMGGLERVDVILRRVDDIYCDPLELKEDSQLGVAGLLQAIRSGNVALANPIGCSILESPGLMPFLNNACQYLLGEDLHIPNIATWWCGQKKEMNYVLENMHRLVIKRIYRDSMGSSAIEGEALSYTQLESLKQQIIAQPYLYVGQERVNFSSTPTLVNGKISQRNALYRTFLVTHNDSYVSMKGGLTLTSETNNDFLISGQHGGFSKDTWILAPEPEQNMSLRKTLPNVQSISVLPSHTAENLFWVGRYVERFLGNARFLRTVMQAISEGNRLNYDTDIQTETSLLQALTHCTFTYPGFLDKNGKEKISAPWPELRSIFLDTKRPGSLHANFNVFNRTVYAVRDHWSSDTWRVLRSMEAEWNAAMSNTTTSPIRMLSALDSLITSTVAFVGLNRESISRDQGWAMLDMGRKIEQSLLLVNMIRFTLVLKKPDQVEYNLQEALLKSHESLVNFRYKYKAPLQLPLVLDLMIFDPNNPRSLLYQLERLKGYSESLPKPNLTGTVMANHERLVFRIYALLKLSDKQELGKADKKNDQYKKLDILLNKLYTLISDVPDAISKTYFKHAETQKQLFRTEENV